MSECDDQAFAHQLASLRWRLDALYRRSRELALPLEELQLLPEAFDELCSAAEELHLAQEQMQLQNERLAEACQQVEIQRRRYQELFDFAPEAYLVSDAHGVVTEANQAAGLLLHCAPTDLVGKPLVGFVDLNQRRFFRLELLRLLQSATAGEWQVRLVRGNGERSEAVCRVVPLYSPGAGAPVALRWLLQEVSRSSQTLLTATPRPELVCARGEAIALSPEVMYQVHCGLVKLTALHLSGEEVLVGLAGPGAPFGGFPSTSPITFRATAMTTVQLVRLSTSQLDADAQLCRQLLPRLRRRQQFSEMLLAIVGQQRATDRLAGLLRLLVAEYGEPVAGGSCLPMRLTHEELASAVGTARVTVTNLLREFRREGWLTQDERGRLIVRDDRVARTARRLQALPPV